MPACRRDLQGALGVFLALDLAEVQGRRIVFVQAGGCVKNSEYGPGIKAAVNAVKKRCALLVGASENSLAKVKEKLDICGKEDIDGVVMTAPYYFKTGEGAIVNFLRKTASMTEKDFYVYDHEAITKHKLNLGMLRELADVKNFKGVKSYDLLFIKQIINNPFKEDFTAVFSGSDMFDMSYLYGIRHYMDGIFSCMPKNISKVRESFDSGDYESAKKLLGAMMKVRDEMFVYGIWAAFSYAMNLLGYEGDFAPDYEPVLSDKGKEVTEDCLVRLGEI